jgi:hypothetical protein
MEDKAIVEAQQGLFDRPGRGFWRSPPMRRWRAFAASSAGAWQRSSEMAAAA